MPPQVAVFVARAESSASVATATCLRHHGSVRVLSRPFLVSPYVPDITARFRVAPLFTLWPVRSRLGNSVAYSVSSRQYSYEDGVPERRVEPRRRHAAEDPSLRAHRPVGEGHNACTVRLGVHKFQIPTVFFGFEEAPATPAYHGTNDVPEFVEEPLAHQ